MFIFQLLCEHYTTEVAGLEEVKKEYSMLTTLLESQYNALTTTQVLQTVQKVHGDTMPNLAKLAAAMAVLPVSTAGMYMTGLSNVLTALSNCLHCYNICPFEFSDCERGFSSMKRVKTSLRNRMKESTLNNLLMISMEGPPAEEFNFHAACDSWAGMARRRLNVI